MLSPKIFELLAELAELRERQNAVAATRNYCGKKPASISNRCALKAERPDTQRGRSPMH